MELKMPRYRHVSGLGNVQFTPEEEAERDAEEAQWKKEQEEYKKVLEDKYGSININLEDGTFEEIVVEKKENE